MGIQLVGDKRKRPPTMDNSNHDSIRKKSKQAVTHSSVAKYEPHLINNVAMRQFNGPVKNMTEYVKKVEARARKNADDQKKKKMANKIKKEMKKKLQKSANNQEINHEEMRQKLKV